MKIVIAKIEEAMQQLRKDLEIWRTYQAEAQKNAAMYANHIAEGELKLEAYDRGKLLLENCDTPPQQSAEPAPKPELEQRDSHVITTKDDIVWR